MDLERVVCPFDDGPTEYPENVVKTSRYNAFSFLPKSLFEQFRRLANVYFIVLGAIATVGTYTSAYNTAIEPIGLHTFTTQRLHLIIINDLGILGPVALVVLISIAKEGVEDIK